MAARLVPPRAVFPSRMTPLSPTSRSARAARPPRVTSVRAATDDDAPELPDYDIVALGPSLETSALALGAQGWMGGSDDANAYVAAVDRGYLLFGARAPSELALLKEYERYWRLSDAAQLPGSRPPRVYASVELGANGTSVLDTLQAHAIAAGGVVPDLFCFRLAPGADPAAVAAGVAAAVELGACPADVAVDGFDGATLEAFVAAARRRRAAGARGVRSCRLFPRGSIRGDGRYARDVRAIGRRRGGCGASRRGRSRDGPRAPGVRRGTGAVVGVPGEHGGGWCAAVADAGGAELGGV